VHRVDHRGWRISAFDGIDIDASTEADIDTLEASWRASRSRLLGFAMSMGPYERRVHPDDLYLLARDPEGRLSASMRFITHRGKLSLDTMRRVAQAPNGLNEALICRALEVARQRGIPEVSLNYAGLAHVIRDGADGGRLRRRARTLVIRTLGRHFQMERLVRFNDKFDPEWRNRYLLYEKRRSLPSAVVRVLQAEGYLPARAPVSASATFWQRAPRATIQRRGAAARGR
jgi:lysyl-tRNA synthetase class 2